MALSTPVLGYYDLENQLHASAKGLAGAVILQEDTPIAYASRALTSTQEKYAQIEKKTLFMAPRNSISTFYGKPVTVQSDHKPLEHILSKPLHHAPLP